MSMPIDIFRLESEESVLWIEAASSPETAKSRVADLIQKVPADYLIIRLSTGEKNIVKRGEQISA